MESSALQYFQKAIETPSPSGFEEPIQQLNREYIESHAEDIRTDIHGNLIASIGDTDGPRLMYAGHCDQIGMLISHLDDSGFLYAKTIGGWDPQQLVGQAMAIWASDGPIPAVISRKPIHLLTDAERKRVASLDELWLDIGSSSKAETASMVRIGDPVTLELGYRELQNGLVTGPGMDNKTGMWAVLESLRRVAVSEDSLACHLHCVATVQEEIGLRGARTAAGSVNPEVAIAVDVTHATDCPTIEKTKHGDLKIGGGPVIFRGPNINRKVSDRLVELCESNDIEYQLAAVGRATPNDANALQIHGQGVATGLIGIPNRYMHSATEVISLEDIDRVAQLLTLFAKSLTGNCDFTPRLAMR